MLPRVTDRETRLHLEDSKDQIAKILDPKFLPPSPAPATPGAGTRRGLDETDTCWPDYGIYGPEPQP